MRLLVSLLVLPFLAVWFAASITCALNVGPTLTLVPAALVLLAGYYCILSPLRSRGLLSATPALRGKLFAAASLLVIAFSFTRLYSQKAAGLVGFSWTDTAFHILAIERIAVDERDLGGGGTAFHVLAAWFRLLGVLDSFQSMRALFYLSVIAFIVLSLCVFNLATGRGARFFALHFVMYLLALEFIVLPICHQLQAEGHYSQLLGLIPAMLIAAAIAARPKWTMMLPVFASALFLQLYSFPLQVFEIIFAFAGYVLLANWELETKYRRALGLSLFVLACAFFAPLSSAADVGVDRKSLDLPIVLILTFSAGLLLVISGSVRRQHKPFAEVVLFFAFIVSTAAVRIGAQWIIQGYFAPELLQGIVLPLILSVIALILIQIETFRDSLLALKSGELSFIIGTGTSAGLVLITASFLLLAYPRYLRPLRFSYAERTRLMQSVTPLYPLQDRAAVSLIRTILADEGRKFGGFLAEPIPSLVDATNAELGYSAARALPWFPDIPLRTDSGYCVFWNSDAQSMFRLERGYSKKLYQLVKNLQTQPQLRTVRYISSWDEQRRDLSYLCK